MVTTFRRSRRLPAALVIAVLMLAIFAANAGRSEAEAAPIKVFVDVQAVKFDVDPFIDGGVTLVEIRSLFDEMGISLDWKSGSSVINGSKDDMSFTLTIGSNAAVVNGAKTTLAASARIVNGRTVVPLRFIAEATGAFVAWDHVNREITVFTESFLASLGATKEDAQRWVEEYLASLEQQNESGTGAGAPNPTASSPAPASGGN